MRVTHRYFDVRVPQEFFDCDQVNAPEYQLGRESMTQVVKSTFGDPGSLNGAVEGFLDRRESLDSV